MPFLLFFFIKHFFFLILNTDYKSCFWREKSMSVKCPVGEMSCRWNVHVGEMSCRWKVHVGEKSMSVKCLVGETVSVKCPVGVIVVGEMSQTLLTNIINVNNSYLKLDIQQNDACFKKSFGFYFMLFSPVYFLLKTVDFS